MLTDRPRMLDALWSTPVTAMDLWTGDSHARPEAKTRPRSPVRRGRRHLERAAGRRQRAGLQRRRAALRARARRRRQAPQRVALSGRVRSDLPLRQARAHPGPAVRPMVTTAVTHQHEAAGGVRRSSATAPCTRTRGPGHCSVACAAAASSSAPAFGALMQPAACPDGLLGSCSVCYFRQQACSATRACVPCCSAHAPIELCRVHRMPARQAGSCRRRACCASAEGRAAPCRARAAGPGRRWATRRARPPPGAQATPDSAHAAVIALPHPYT